jgi:hypothetical protein
MKVGDLVQVKDLIGYNVYMQNLVGWIGCIVGKKRLRYLSLLSCEEEEVTWEVFILGKVVRIIGDELEIVSDQNSDYHFTVNNINLNYNKK